MCLDRVQRGPQSGSPAFFLLEAELKSRPVTCPRFTDFTDRYQSRAGHLDPVLQHPAPQRFAHCRAAPMHPGFRQCIPLIHPNGPHLHLLCARARRLWRRLGGNRAKGLKHQNNINPFSENGKYKIRSVIL